MYHSEESKKLLKRNKLRRKKNLAKMQRTNFPGIRLYFLPIESKTARKQMENAL